MKNISHGRFSVYFLLLVASLLVGCALPKENAKKFDIFYVPDEMRRDVIRSANLDALEWREVKLGQNISVELPQGARNFKDEKDLLPNNAEGCIAYFRFILPTMHSTILDLTFVYFAEEPDGTVGTDPISRKALQAWLFSPEGLAYKNGILQNLKTEHTTKHALENCIIDLDGQSAIQYSYAYTLHHISKYRGYMLVVPFTQKHSLGMLLETRYFDTPEGWADRQIITDFYQRLVQSLRMDGAAPSHDPPLKN